MALTNAQMQAIVAAGGSVIWPPGAEGSAITTIAALPSDAAIAAYLASHPAVASVISTGPLAVGSLPFANASGMLTSSANYTINPVTGALNLFDLSGTSLHDFTAYTPRKIEITHGTSGAPETVYGPTMKMSRTESFSSLPVSGVNVDTESNATLAVYSLALAASVEQNTAVYGVANNSTTAISADAVGGYFTGRILGSGTNNGTGLFASGRRDSVLAMCKGAEINVTDLSGGNEGVVTNGQSRALGLGVSYKGTNGFATGVGVSIEAFANSGQFDSGYQVIAGAVKNYAYRDDSSAGSSYAVTGGTHSYGYDANLGTYTTSIMRMNGIVSTGADGQSAVQMNPDMRLSGARTTIYGLLNIPIVDSSDGTSGGTMNNVTSFVNGNFARVDTAVNYTGTITNVAAFHAGDTSKGNAGAAITNEYGFYCDNLTVGATVKTGFYSNVAASAGAANFYAAGTAINVFTGGIYAQGGLLATAGTGTGLLHSITQTPASGNAIGEQFGRVVAGNNAYTTDISVYVPAATRSGSSTVTTAIGIQVDAPTLGGTTNTGILNNGSLKQAGNVAFYGTNPVAKQTVTGAKGSNAALGSLMTALAALGLVTDSTTA